jgi:hypothetical protein
VQQVQQSGLVASISGSTLWRWLHEDAIRPWYQRSWVFPRDPEFATKAGRVLDLYAREWQGCALQEDEFVISADEKTSIQARRRMPPRPAGRTLPCGSSMSTFGAALGPISLPSMYTTPKSLAAVKPKMALHLLIDSSNKS